MKLYLNYITLIAITMIISSCGPSAQEQQAIQQHIIDSTTNAVTQRMEAKQQLKNKCANLQSLLERTNASLAVANDEMNYIKKFQILRAQSEREQQIGNQTIKIQQINDRIQELRNQLAENQNQLASY